VEYTTRRATPSPTPSSAAGSIHCSSGRQPLESAAASGQPLTCKHHYAVEHGGSSVLRCAMLLPWNARWLKSILFLSLAVRTSVSLGR